MLNEKLNKLLINKFPNLKDKYLDEVSWQEGDNTGSHVVYGDVLTPYLSECIKNNNQQEFQNIFNFLEELLLLEDKYIDEVVYFSVFESVIIFFKDNDYLFSYLGTKCKQAIIDLKNS